jgi:hypothetical protein
MDLHTFIPKSTSKIQPFLDSVMFFKQEVSVVTLGVAIWEQVERENLLMDVHIFIQKSTSKIQEVGPL